MLARAIRLTSAALLCVRGGRANDGQNRPLDCLRQPVPERNHALQISANLGHCDTPTRAWPSRVRRPAANRCEYSRCTRDKSRKTSPSAMRSSLCRYLAGSNQRPFHAARPPKGGRHTRVQARAPCLLPCCPRSRRAGHGRRLALARVVLRVDAGARNARLTPFNRHSAGGRCRNCNGPEGTLDVSPGRVSPHPRSRGCGGRNAPASRDFNRHAADDCCRRSGGRCDRAFAAVAHVQPSAPIAPRLPSLPASGRFGCGDACPGVPPPAWRRGERRPRQCQRPAGEPSHPFSALENNCRSGSSKPGRTSPPLSRPSGPISVGWSGLV